MPSMEQLQVAPSNGVWRFRHGHAECIAALPVPGVLAVGSSGQLSGMIAGSRLFTLRGGAWVQVAEL